MDIEVIISHFRQVLRDVNAEAIRHGPKLGSPPTSLIVEQRAASSHPSFNTGAALRRWRVTTEAATDVAVDEPLSSEAISGLYYHCGRADFSLHEDARKVRIGWQVGPRYGRGYDLPIEHGPNGVARLGTAKPIWVS